MTKKRLESAYFSCFENFLKIFNFFCKKVLTFAKKRGIISPVADKWRHKWEFSSAGRASALQAEGHRFEPYNSHHVWPSSSVG